MTSEAWLTLVVVCHHSRPLCCQMGCSLHSSYYATSPLVLEVGLQANKLLSEMEESKNWIVLILQQKCLIAKPRNTMYCDRL